MATLLTKVVIIGVFWVLEHPEMKCKMLTLNT